MRKKYIFRWVLRRMVYSYGIECRKAEKFGNANILSHLPDTCELSSAETVSEIHAEKVIEKLPMNANQ